MMDYKFRFKSLTDEGNSTLSVISNLILNILGIKLPSHITYECQIQDILDKYIEDTSMLRWHVEIKFNPSYRVMLVSDNEVTNSLFNTIFDESEF